MGLLEDLNSGKYNLVLICILFIFMFHQYWGASSIQFARCKDNKEPMADVSNDIKEAVKQVYLADVEAIRNLSEVAAKLNNKEGLTIPGNLTVSGSITGTLNGNASTATNAANAANATNATNAQNAQNATNAINATNATNASNATNLAGWQLYNSGGRVGIGITNPSYPLHVKGSGTNAYTDGNRLDKGYVGGSQGSSRPVIAGFEGGWVASDTGFIMISDQRIKTDIVNIDTSTNLQLFRKIRPVKYGYIDKLEYGNIIKYGFIAQEIQEILPEAIVEKTQIIPSIYSNAIIKNKSILSFDKSILNLEKLNNGIKLKCYDNKNEIVWVIIKEIIDSQNIEIEENIENEELFVYGHSVDDFLQIEKDTIWTVTTSAVQEIDKQQQNLEKKINEQKIIINKQELIINNILERLNKLENLNNK